MDTLEQMQQDTAEFTSNSGRIQNADFVIAVWQRRRLLALIVGMGMLIATGIAFLIPSEYQSTIQLMPPDSQALSNASVLSALAGGGLIMPSTAGLMNQKTPGAIFIAILGSRTVQDDMINRFDLRRVYYRKLYVDARKKLTTRTTLVEDKKSGVITITVMDHDRYRARALAEAYIEELNRLITGLSTSSARRERVFLEERLKSIKVGLDSSSRALSQFSSRNATFDPQKQGEATVEQAGKLQGELIAVESELSGLRALYTDDNVRVRQARGQIDELRSQLRKMSGVEPAADGADRRNNHLFPSVRELPALGFTYYDLYRQVTMQETLYETLTKQYELAKVQEAKEIPPVKVLDAPELAERKSSPHRTVIILCGILLSTVAGIAWILAGTLWNSVDETHPLKALWIEIVRSTKRRSLPGKDSDLWSVVH